MGDLETCFLIKKTYIDSDGRLPAYLDQDSGHRVRYFWRCPSYALGCNCPLSAAEWGGGYPTLSEIKRWKAVRHTINRDDPVRIDVVCVEYGPGECKFHGPRRVKLSERVVKRVYPKPSVLDQMSDI